MTDQLTLAALRASSHVVPIVYEWPELVFLIIAAYNHEPVEDVRERAKSWPKPTFPVTLATLLAESRRLPNQRHANH